MHVFFTLICRRWNFYSRMELHKSWTWSWTFYHWKQWNSNFVTSLTIKIVLFFVHHTCALFHDSLFFTTRSFSSITWRCASFLPSNDGIVVIKSEHGTQKNKKFQLFNQLKFQNMHETKKKMNQFSADSLRPYKLQLRKYLLCTPYPIPLQSPIN